MTLIQSYLLCTIEAWHSTSQNLPEVLVVMQKSAIIGLLINGYTEMHKSLIWHTNLPAHIKSKLTYKTI